MPLANRSAAASKSSFGVTENRGLIVPSKKETAQTLRPGPGSYNTQNELTTAFGPAKPFKYEPLQDPSSEYRTNQRSITANSRYRSMSRSSSSPSFTRTTRDTRRTRPPTHAEYKEPLAFENTSPRFAWMKPKPVPGVGSYEKSDSHTMQEAYRIKKHYSAKNLTQFGQAARTSAFESTVLTPGPGEYDPPAEGNQLKRDDPHGNSVFMSDVSRFSDKYRHDGIETPAPHDYNVDIEWQFKQTRSPSTFSHQSVFQQQTKATLGGIDAGGRIGMGNSSTSKLGNLGPGAHEYNRTIEHQCKQAHAVSAGSAFASSSMRFGHGALAYGPQCGKREKWHTKLTHQATVEKIRGPQGKR